MRRGNGLVWCLCLAVLVPLLNMGCRRAGKFGPKPTDEEKADSAESGDKSSKDKNKKPSPKKEKPAPLPADYAWMAPTAKGRKQMEAEVPIKFVARGTDAKTNAEWDKLDNEFWTLIRTPATPLGKARQEVRIRVPLGLADPTPHIPGSNPPTAGKWALGKRLFFDDGYLWPSSLGRQACATCHKPEHGFTDDNSFPSIKTASLINVVYNRDLFWDGRASALEEVVQRVLEDEREPTEPDAEKRKVEAERRHVWSGVVKRLRANQDYQKQFRKVFGTPPTQDNIGKALATYLRTILAGDSLYDKARLEAKGEALQERHFDKLLGKESVRKALAPEASKKNEVAKDLLLGYHLFQGPARCSACHTGPNFTDNGFHNIGVDETQASPVPGKEAGRFAQLPIGLKDSRLIGAFKTPTLRALLQIVPYFHNGTGKAPPKEVEGHDLIDAVMRHVKPPHPGPYLDPLLRDLKLPENDVRALAVFLRSLNGTVDDVVADPKTQPEGVPQEGKKKR